MTLKKENLLHKTIHSQISDMFILLYNMTFNPHKYPYVKILWSSNLLNNTINNNKKYIHVPGLSTTSHPDFCDNITVHMHVVYIE